MLLFSTDIIAKMINNKACYIITILTLIPLAKYQVYMQINYVAFIVIMLFN